MGTIVAGQLPQDCETIIIDSNEDKARVLAQKTGGISSKDLAVAKDADVVMILLPTCAVEETVENLLDIVKDGSIIINMATAACIAEKLSRRRENISIVEAKVIGHAASMSCGEPAFLVVSCEKQARFEFIKSLFPGFAKVEQGDARLVEKINSLSSQEAITTAVRLRKQLKGMAIPEDWIIVAIRTVCAGTMKAFAENDLGPFAEELIKELEYEVL